MTEFYDKGFYDEQKDGSMLSAIEILPRVLKVIQPQSVLDIGCGVGTWLNVLKHKHGVKEVLGIDGDYVDKNTLLIDKSEFVPFDLENVFTPTKRFDFAMSLEVGEHLPDKCADNLVQSLVNSSDFVMFSAALPGQQGTHHINEQWPEYWAKKFTDKGYVCVDYIRKEVWNKKEIKFWYRQNILLYIKEEVFEAKYKDKLDLYRKRTDPEFLTRIHPELMLHYLEKHTQTSSFIGFMRYKLYPLKKLFSGKRKEA